MASSRVPVFVVAHPKFVERYNYITQHLVDRRVAQPVFVGVVGKDVIEARGGGTHQSGQTPGQIGCALSHITAYRHMVNLGIEIAVVLEDDAVLPPDFNDTISAIIPHIREGEIISLHSPTMEQRILSTHGSIKVGSSRICYPMEAAAVRSTLCYVIHLGAARRILLANEAGQYGADDFACFWEQGLINHLRIASPQIVRAAGFESVIGYHRGPFLRMLARLANRMPVSSTYLEKRRERTRLLRDLNHIFTDDVSEIELGNRNYE